MNRHLLYPACLLGGIALTAVGVGAVRLLNRAVDRWLRSHFERAGVAYRPRERRRPHPLAPVVPLPTGHVRLVNGDDRNAS